MEDRTELGNLPSPPAIGDAIPLRLLRATKTGKGQTDVQCGEVTDYLKSCVEFKRDLEIQIFFFN